MNQLLDIIKNAKKQTQQEADEAILDSYVCKYCEKSFRKESTLAVHLCEPKRRHEQRNDRHVQLGFRAFLRFYELTQGSANRKKYEDFAKSSFYKGFVKFGKHLLDIKAVNPDYLIDWVIKNDVKLDKWCHEEIYVTYLEHYINKEEPELALERTMKTMIKWSEKNGEDLGDFFNRVAIPRLVSYIRDGRISPWIIYNCEQGQDSLAKMNDEQLGLIFNVVDPRLWKMKNKNYPGDSEFIKHILNEAGIK